MSESINIKEKTISGVRWTGLSHGVQTGFTFLITIILARLLEPEDFGLIAIASTFMVFIGFLNEFGIGSSIVQKEVLGQKEISSIFWFNLLVGILTTGITILIAPFIAVFFKEPRLGPILMILSSAFFLSSLCIVQQSLLSKSLEFKFLYLVRISCSIISGLLAIILAYNGFGVWSLVCQVVAENFFTAILLWLPGRWYPLRHFRWSEVRMMMNFSLNYLGFNIVNSFSERAPHLLIGKFLGSEALGFYALALRLVAHPLETVSYITGNVLFPVFSKIQKDNIRIGDLYLQAMKHTGFLVFPVMIGLLITAPELIQVVFGEKWKDTIFVLQVLSVAGFIQAISTNNSVLYLSKGRTDVQLKMSLLSLFIIAVALYIGTRWGINGVAIGYTMASFVIIYPSLRIPYGIINLKIYRLLLMLKEVFLISAIMGIPTFMVAYLLRSYGIAPLFILTSSVLTGIVVYILCSLLINRSLLTSFYEMINLRV